MSSVLRFDEWQDSEGNPVLNGTALSVPSSALPAGSILQVVTFETGTRTTTTSTSFANTLITATITPTSVTSKVLILVTGVGERSNVNAQSFAQLFRGDVTGTALGPATGTTWYEAQASFIYVPFSLSLLDSPATTSATTYTVGLKTQQGTAAVRDAQVITLMEVAG